MLADGVGYGDGRDFGAHGVGWLGFVTAAMGRAWVVLLGCGRAGSRVSRYW